MAGAWYKRKVSTMRESVIVIIGAIGALVAQALGGWDTAFTALSFFIATDYIMGLIVAGIFKTSKKSENGALNSHIGFKGIVKKVMMFVMVAVAHHVDIIIGKEFMRYGVMIAFMANELLSIIENAGLMGIYIPDTLKQAVDILNKKGGGHKNEQGD